MAMVDPKTATRRLNLAQAFNPFGSLLGMFVASTFILSHLQSDRRDTDGNLLFDSLDFVEKAVIKTQDLSLISTPYIVLGFVVIAMFILIAQSMVQVPLGSLISSSLVLLAHRWIWS